MSENNEGMDSESSGIIRRSIALCICDATVFFLLCNASKVEVLACMPALAPEIDTDFLCEGLVSESH